MIAKAEVVRGGVGKGLRRSRLGVGPIWRRAWPVSCFTQTKMALRIDCRDVAGGTAIVVAGELDAAGSAELQKLCHARRGAVTIDLDQLVSADAASIAILRALRGEGACLVGASHYIRLLIDRNGRSDTHPDAAREDA